MNPTSHLKIAGSIAIYFAYVAFSAAASLKEIPNVRYHGCGAPAVSPALANDRFRFDHAKLAFPDKNELVRTFGLASEFKDVLRIHPAIGDKIDRLASFWLSKPTETSKDRKARRELEAELRRISDPLFDCVMRRLETKDVTFKSMSIRNAKEFDGKESAILLFLRPFRQRDQRMDYGDAVTFWMAAERNIEALPEWVCLHSRYTSASCLAAAWRQANEAFTAISYVSEWKSGKPLSSPWDRITLLLKERLDGEYHRVSYYYGWNTPDPKKVPLLVGKDTLLPVRDSAGGLVAMIVVTQFSAESYPEIFIRDNQSNTGRLAESYLRTLRSHEGPSTLLYPSNPRSAPVP